MSKALGDEWTPSVDPHDMDWRNSDVKARTKYQMPHDISPWSDLKPRLTGVPQHMRYPRLLDVAYYKFLIEEKKGKAQRGLNGRPKWFADLSQGPDRGHFGARPTGMIQNTVYYSFEHDVSFLAGWGHKMLGFPDVDLSGLAKSSSKSLSGESMDLPSLAIILYAIYLCPAAPWWKQQAADTSLRGKSGGSQLASGEVPKRRRLPPTFVLD
jgi:hypothetical protein